jgi:hypothetical protein
MGPLVAAILAHGTAALAQAEDWPRLTTNQSYIEEVSRPTTLAIDDPMAVFAFVLNSLPDRVKVYPTENYYYFTFVHRGVPFNGNIRLDASDRDQGKVHFAYSEDMAEWRRETPLTYRLLDASSGVMVEKLERFLYRVTYAGRSVLFALNDLSQAKPPADALAPDETFVGPVADESGLRFFLVFNERLKFFLYILDETADVPEGFDPAPRTDRILIGKRTGYAFYRDRRLPRKILIGVFFSNSRVNNYFDGPFDQLPDNFIEGEAFRAMLLKAEPSLKGKIDRFGGSPDGSQRHMIAPYFYYATVDELTTFHRCAADPRVPAADYYACFVADEQSQYRFKLLPLAFKKMGRGIGPQRR